MSRKERKRQSRIDRSKKPWIDDTIFALMDKHNLTYEEAWDEIISQLVAYAQNRDTMKRYAKKLQLNHLFKSRDTSPVSLLKK